MCLHGRAELALAPDEYGGLVMVLLRMLAFGPPRVPAVGAGAGLATQAQAAAASAPASASATPARAAIALQAPQAAKAAVALGARAPGRPAPARRVEPDLAAMATPAGPPTPAEQAGEGVGPVEAADASAPPAWLDAPELDALAAPVAGATAPAAGPRGRGPASTTADAPAAAASPARARLQATELGARWAAAVDALIERGSVTALVRELAWQAQCLSISEADPDGNRPALWRLRVEREMLRAPAHCERLQNALSEWLGAPLKLEAEAGRTDDTPALRALADREQRQLEAEQIIAEDPLVRSLLSQYRTARIVPGSIQPG